jgi:hypothetical protein
MVGDSMEEEDFYINEAMEFAFSTYIEKKDHKGTLAYNTFICTIVRMFVLIYGEEVIFDYQTKNPATLIYTISKNGTPIDDANNFVKLVDRFYQFEKKNSKKAIRKKNKYFNVVQKFLIDMLINKYKIEKVDNKTLKEFYKLLFTANSSSFYRRTNALVMAYDPYEIDDYFKKQIVGVKKHEKKDRS